jgi:hypothetical protein
MLDVFLAGNALSSYIGFMDFIYNMAPGVIMATVVCIPLILFIYRKTLTCPIQDHKSLMEEVAKFRITNWPLFAKCGEWPPRNTLPFERWPRACGRKGFSLAQQGLSVWSHPRGQVGLRRVGRLLLAASTATTHILFHVTPAFSYKRHNQSPKNC